MLEIKRRHNLHMRKETARDIETQTDFEPPAPETQPAVEDVFDKELNIKITPDMPKKEIEALRKLVRQEKSHF